jgi:predicted RNA-binding Zn ribbon-like protein
MESPRVRKDFVVRPVAGRGRAKAVFGDRTAGRRGVGVSLEFGDALQRRPNRATTRLPVRQELLSDGTVVRHGPIRAVIRVVLATLARDADEPLTAPAGPVTECAAPRCTCLYIDRSYRSSRRWCDMTRCGNLAKAANHRSRHNL